MVIISAAKPAIRLAVYHLRFRLGWSLQN